MVIGSRLLEDRAIAGGMPRWKWLGNRLLTGIENRAFGVSFSEYHTGYRAFSADLLRSIPFLRNSDDFVFDQEIFAQVSRATPAWSRSRSRRATSTRPRASTSCTSVRYAPPDALAFLGRAILARRPRRGWTPCSRRVPPARALDDRCASGAAAALIGAAAW